MLHSMITETVSWCSQVTAVYKAELSSYVDVVVVSVDNHCFKGEPLQRHLASMTGGGEA